MLFNYSELFHKNVKELKALFTAIPKSESSVEFYGVFECFLFSNTTFIQALTFLPKHITHVTFSGNFHYEHSYIVTSTQGGWNAAGHGYHYEYSTRGSYEERLGNELSPFIQALPETVHSLMLSFISTLHLHITSTVAADLWQLLPFLPHHIKQLYLNLDKPIAPALIAHIPKTVKSLIIRDEEISPALFKAIRPTIQQLHLPDCQWQYLSPKTFLLIPSQLTSLLKVLDLSNNQLHERNLQQLESLFASLSQKTQCIKLAGNHLTAFNVPSLIKLIGALGGRVEAIDLSENGLLLLSKEDLQVVFSSLSPNIRRLRICEANNPVLTAAKLSEQWQTLPLSLTTLELNSSDFYGLPLKEFAQSLAHLPKHINVLDFSANALAKKLKEQVSLFSILSKKEHVIALFSALPKTVTTLLLKNNQLISLTPQDLNDLLTSLRWVDTIDISENGFDCLYPSELHAFLAAIPPTIRWVIVDKNTFTVKNGCLVANTSAMTKSLFFHSAPGVVYNQQPLAPVLLPLMQMVYSGKLPLDLIGMVFSFYTQVSPKERNHIVLQISKLRISSIPPKEVTLLHQKACLFAVEQRIKNLSLKQQSHLDLSRCGLNRLDSHEPVTNLLENIAEQITSISFRGNGLTLRKESLVFFIALLKELPENIKHLDLSDNGFEDYTPEQLAQLLLHLPSTVEYITLEEEMPLSPAALLARRHWPQSYYALTDNQSPFEQGCSLLKDYTKGNAAGRFFTGHWNRHHVPAVAKLLYLIQQGIITTATDLLQELQQIPVENNAGSLARRISFFANAKRIAKKEAIDQPEGSAEELEQTNLSLE